MTAVEAAQEDVDTDMTPMIDCVFLMIIFFVCIDFRVLEAKLPAYLPRDAGSSPTRVEPQQQLPVAVFAAEPGTWTLPGHAGTAAGRPRREVLRGHTVTWRVGPTPVADERDLLALLQRIHDDLGTWQDDPDHPGRKKPMTVVVEPHPGTYYDDVARTTDAVRAAGFVEVEFGGGLGALPARGR